MNPMMLRRFWALIETTRTNMPLSLDDNSLSQWVLRQVRSEQSFNTAEADVLNDYIQTRLPLIRELAQEYQPSC